MSRDLAHFSSISSQSLGAETRSRILRDAYGRLRSTSDPSDIWTWSVELVGALKTLVDRGIPDPTTDEILCHMKGSHPDTGKRRIFQALCPTLLLVTGLGQPEEDEGGLGVQMYNVVSHHSACVLSFFFPFLSVRFARPAFQWSRPSYCVKWRRKGFGASWVLGWVRFLWRTLLVPGLFFFSFVFFYIYGHMYVAIALGRHLSQQVTNTSALL
ncbi:hypothetical protein BDV19DRAFT_295085 [Aspergillus venezuelensis]